MSRRITIIQGHPDPDERRLCRALADAYVEGAHGAGHPVTWIDLATLDFPLLRTRHAFEHGALPDSLRPAATAIVEADHIVLVFPLWHGTAPALVQAFLEQVMRPGIALAYQNRGVPRPLLRHRSARIVVTMGMPALAYRWWYRAHGVHAIARSILGVAGIRPTGISMFGMVGNARAATRRRWLERMRTLGSQAR